MITSRSLPSSKAPPESLCVAVHGADTPRGRELASLLRLHPHVGAAQEIASDGSVLVGWDGAAEPRWGDGPGRGVDVDVVFVCLPQDRAAPVIMDAVESGARVIDLAGSLGGQGVGLGMPRDAGDGETAYGLPEFASEEVRTADHVVNASSVATCATIALGPMAMAGLLGPRVEVEAVHGVLKRARPRKPEEVREEVQENLRELHRSPREPYLELDRRIDPAQRGVLTRANVKGDGLAADAVHTLYATFYSDAPCVEVLPQGLPALPAVEGTNKVQVGVSETEQGVEIACTLDDSIKGAVGQAIQNMNVMCGYPETLGLPDFELTPAETGPRAMKRPDL